MNTQEQARELAAQERQHNEHVKEAMLNRAEAQAHNPAQDNLTQQHARQLIAQERRHDEHVKESMLSRAKAEIDSSSDAADSSAP